MATAAYDIPPVLVQSFRNAIQKVHDWHRYGGSEPTTTYEQMRCPVSSIAWQVSAYGDQMPGDIYYAVCSAADSLVSQPEDRTFAAGGACLYLLCLRLRETGRAPPG
jgi:hypothetical protein